MNKDLIKKYGEGVFVTGTQFLELKKQKIIISVSPKLDIILGGGIPSGSMVTLAGKKKCGKSTLALRIAAKCQKLGRKVIYLNIEGRLKRRDLLGIKGLNPDDIIIVQSEPNKILMAEDYLKIAEAAIHDYPGACIIIDSVSQLVSEKEFLADIGSQQRAPGAILMAQFCKKICNVVPVNDIIIISILHMIANTSGFGASEVASGGKKIGYAADVELVCKGFTLLRPGAAKDAKDDDNSKEPAYGQKVIWQTLSTAIAPPGQQIESILRYGIGIDDVAEIIDLAIDTGFIRQSGAWMWLDYLQTLGRETQSIQGKEKLYNYFLEHQEEAELLNTEIRKMLIPGVYNDEAGTN